MLDEAKLIFSNLNPYTITLLIMVGMLVLSLISKNFKQNIETPLKLCTLFWLIFFGYKVYTGEHLYSLFSGSQKPEKYKKVMIDGRPVYYDEKTGEVFKKKPKSE